MTKVDATEIDIMNPISKDCVNYSRFNHVNSHHGPRSFMDYVKNYAMRKAGELAINEYVQKVGVGAAIGAVAGTATLAAVGLGVAGPIAGGLFAGKMGAGLVSGGYMAMLQSSAMTGAFVATTTKSGAIVGAVVAHKQSKLQSKL